MIAAVADAVVQALNASPQPWAIPFTAERVDRPRIDRERLTELQVLVVPRARRSDLLTRGSQQREFVVDVGLLAPLAGEGIAHTDPLVALVESIAERFERPENRRLAALPQCVLTAATYGDDANPLFAPEPLDQQRTFVAVVSLTYRVLQ